MTKGTDMGECECAESCSPSPSPSPCTPEVPLTIAHSAVDLASQVVISISEHLMQQKSDHYPVGRSRLEALGVIACASIMSMASVEVCATLYASRQPTPTGMPVVKLCKTYLGVMVKQLDREIGPYEGFPLEGFPPTTGGSCQID